MEQLEEEVKEILKTAFDNLEFETGKAIIKSESIPSLTELAEVLLKKEGWKLTHPGCTVKLSVRRGVESLRSESSLVDRSSWAFQVVSFSSRLGGLRFSGDALLLSGVLTISSSRKFSKADPQVTCRNLFCSCWERDF